MRPLRLPFLTGSEAGTMLGTAGCCPGCQGTHRASVPLPKVSPAPLQSSKKSYLVGTAAAQGKAGAGDKDESREPVLNTKVNSSDKYISAEPNLSLFPILGCLWARCSHRYVLLLLKVMHALLVCFRAWLAREKEKN